MTLITNSIPSHLGFTCFHVLLPDLPPSFLLFIRRVIICPFRGRRASRWRDFIGWAFMGNLKNGQWWERGHAVSHTCFNNLTKFLGQIIFQIGLWNFSLNFTVVVPGTGLESRLLDWVLSLFMLKTVEWQSYLINIKQFHRFSEMSKVIPEWRTLETGFICSKIDGKWLW